MCFERCLLTCTGSNFGPRFVLNVACWHVVGPTLGLNVFWEMSADMYRVQLGPRCVLSGVCWYVRGATVALDVFDGFSAEIYWVQLWPWMCFEGCLLTCTGFNFGPRCVLNDACWYLLSRTLALSMFQTMSADMYWVQLWPKKCFERWLLTCTGSNLGPTCVLHGVCWYLLGTPLALDFFQKFNDVWWHVLGPTLALDVSWMVSAHIYWVQLWPYMCFERCFLTCTGCNFGP